jgi:uncharacterized membrane protein/thiol-disulfide isomerase/thioredoxin
VVHAVLFYSPTCPHCHQLITEYLIPLQNRYGKRLVILGMDTSQEWANNLYWEAMRYYELPQDDWVVPILIVADQVMVGGNEVPARFPSIIEEGLASGGIDLPDFPALINFLREQDALDPRYPDRFIMRQAPAEEGGPPPPGSDSAVSEEPVAADSSISESPVAGMDPNVGDSASDGVADTSLTRAAPEVGDTAGGEVPVAPAQSEGGQVVESAAPEVPAATRPKPEGPFGLAEAARGMESMTMRDRFAMDPAGNSLSVLVLMGMLLSLVLRGYPPRLGRGRGTWPTWVVPALVMVGAGVAAYLSFIEVTHVEAVCGPVGDCNTVNQSEYAVLFGVLPVGVLGLMGYGAMMVLWVLGHSGSAETSRRATLGLWAAALMGTLFSVYLTFLEPFVIGATCAWCLTSAVVMTLLLWSTAPMAARVWPGGNRATTGG